MKRRVRSRWRPISTAPKDEQILLLYPGHDQLPFVCQGRWVNVPHENEANRRLMNFEALEPQKGSWQAGYIGIQCRSGAEPRSFSAQSFVIFPTHWQPLPKPLKRWRYTSSL